MAGKGKVDTFLLPQSDDSIANIHLSAKCPGSSASSHLSMVLESDGHSFPRGQQLGHIYMETN